MGSYIMKPKLSCRIHHTNSSLFHYFDKVFHYVHFGHKLFDSNGCNLKSVWL